MVEALERARLREVEACQAIPDTARQSKTEAELLALEGIWRAARHKRAHLEIQLWLADCQWAREEREEYLRQVEARLNASPTSKT